MQKNFDIDTLEIYLNWNEYYSAFRLTIMSDYSESPRKQQLWVNENSLTKELENFWKSIKTKKLIYCSTSFDEIDWYDSMTDIYETPIAYIQRGLKKARLKHRSHGSIPKDWSFGLRCEFKASSTIGPIMEVLSKALGYKLDEKMKKEITKAFRPFLQKKVRNANYSNYNEDW